MQLPHMNFFLNILTIGLCAVILIILLRRLYKMFMNYRRFGVPFIKTNDNLIAALLDSLELRPWEIFLDLWCGDGIVMAAVLEKFPGVSAIGYEVLPKALELSAHYKNKYGERFVIKNNDFMKEDFSHADVVYCYLLPRFITPIREKIKKECKPWTLFYSNVFQLDGVEPHQTIEVSLNTGKVNTLYIYLV